MVVVIMTSTFGGVSLAIRQRTREQWALWREQSRYHLTDNALTWHRLNDVDVIVRFDEITSIVEGAEWLNVMASTGWRIPVPRDVARYDELRTALEKYKPVVKAKRKSSSRFYFALAVPILVVLSLALMMSTHDHTVRVVSAGVLVVVLTWQYVCLPLIQVLRKGNPVS
ncbi:MAG TPA: hypothetical protein VGL89_14910 [Candidatus Koribacter sp.]|jgi:hypothetical protein